MPHNSAGKKHGLLALPRATFLQQQMWRSVMLQRKFDYLDAIAPAAAARKRPELRVANDHDAPVTSAARTLQSELGRVFAQESSWSVRRTVAIGVVFHLGIFCALGLAAGGALSQFAH
ncbi:hypothetical protein EIB18_09075 [Caulobacter vibrioides]|nr:hypothetical protein CA608_09370 [Caulobacter vibrioides]AZH12847.1 hypothetical protein EIB18_09075 [Caulobacter vibrioides]PLR09483.1 hypothetical protein CVUC_14775 [Caulobacter vibrioides]